jgi:hypothetical protein
MLRGSNILVQLRGNPIRHVAFSSQRATPVLGGRN